MKIGLFYPNDLSANPVRAKEIKNFLESKDHIVKIYGFNPSSYLRYGYLTEPIWYLLGRKQYMVNAMKKWANIIGKIIKKEKFDAIICGYLLYAYVLTKDLDCLKIYDCPTPAVDELIYSGNYDNEYLNKLRDLELKIYDKSDYVTFHWETYMDYVKKYVYSGNNLVALNWGCHPKEHRVDFYSSMPKIIYLGNLAGYWINENLLSYLTKISHYPIDVYGSPKPNKKYGLNYKGFAKNTEIIRNYRFGLITITKDKLRCEGFSAKHLEYLSYGLPVFVPEWRQRLDILKGSILYNEYTFSDLLEKYSYEDEWNKMSNISYQQAKNLDWNITLKNLDKIIQKG